MHAGSSEREQAHQPVGTPHTAPPPLVSGRVVITVPTFHPGYRGGGPVRSVAGIVQSTEANVDLDVITADRDLGSDAPYDGLSGVWAPWQNAMVFYLNQRSATHAARVIQDLRRRPPDILYLNSLWHPVFSISFLIMGLLRVIRPSSVLIAPRGELNDGALTISAQKKRLALRVLRPLCRHLPVTWHASTPDERAEILTYFPKAKVIVSINPTALPKSAAPVPSVDRTRLRSVFLSRISPKKNLDVVLRALAEVETPLDFTIYGPSDDLDYWNECRTLIDALPPNISVSYHGPIAAEQVPGVFASCDCFLFPTRGENFGHVVAESLSASCPVICSRHTPWTHVLQTGGGRVVDDSVSGLRRAIEEFACMTPGERREARSSAGRAYEAWRSQQPEGGSVLDVALTARLPAR